MLEWPGSDRQKPLIASIPILLNPRYPASLRALLVAALVAVTVLLACVGAVAGVWNLVALQELNWPEKVGLLLGLAGCTGLFLAVARVARFQKQISGTFMAEIIRPSPLAPGTTPSEPIVIAEMSHGPDIFACTVMDVPPVEIIKHLRDSAVNMEILDGRTVEFQIQSYEGVFVGISTHNHFRCWRIDRPSQKRNREGCPGVCRVYLRAWAGWPGTIAWGLAALAALGITRPNGLDLTVYWLNVAILWCFLEAIILALRMAFWRPRRMFYMIDALVARSQIGRVKPPDVVAA